MQKLKSNNRKDSEDAKKIGLCLQFLWANHFVSRNKNLLLFIALKLRNK